MFRTFQKCVGVRVENDINEPKLTSEMKYIRNYADRNPSKTSNA